MNHSEEPSLRAPSKPHIFPRNFNAVALWAGVTTFVWYAFGAVPVQIAVSEQLGLTSTQSSSWIFIVWFSGAVFSILLSLYYRQPIPITWSTPGLIYLAALAGHFTFSEMVGANLMAGIVILGLGLLGIGGRVMTWLPLPIVMGMFAGNILEYVTHLVKATVEDIVVSGPMVAGYLLGRMIRNPRIPPMGCAVVCGGLAILVTHHITPTPVVWSLPVLAVPEMRFSLSAFITQSLPLVVLAMGLGNVQGLGFLLTQGYRVPVNPVTVVVGIGSVCNALLGGHPANVARNGVAIVASPDAGPLSSRYWASVIAGVLTVTLALAAGTVTSLLAMLPRGFILSLAGLAILSSLQYAFEMAFSSTLRFGALVAFAVAATPFSFGGVTSAFWAILAGFAASLLLERRELIAFWRGKEVEVEEQEETGVPTVAQISSPGADSRVPALAVQDHVRLHT